MSNLETDLSSQLIRAGAGTGKTTNLVNKVFSIYKAYKKNYSKEPKIILTTFTRKATEELRERLLEISCETKNYHFFNYLSSEKIFITSIDGLFFKFLSKNATSIGYPLNFSIAEDKELKKNIKLYLAFSIKNKKEYLLLLNTFSYENLVDIIWQFYTAKLSKTNLRTINKNLLESSYVKIADHLLALQKNLLLKALTKATDDKKIFIFYQGHLDFINYVQNLSDKDKFLNLVNLLIKVKEEFPDVKYSASSGADREIHTAIQKNIAEVRATFLTKGGPGDRSLWDSNENLHKLLEFLLQEVYTKLIDYKKNKGKLSISDLLLLTLKITQQKPELALEFSKKWDYWLIDEYQDTSFLQDKALQSLIGSGTSIIVGDPQQSIYAFRGSEKKVFESKEIKAKASGQLSYLSTNYRSAASLVHFFNDFFKNFNGHFVDLQVWDNAKNTFDNIIFNSASTEEAELEAVFIRIKELKKQGVCYKDIAILAKTKKLLENCSAFLKKKELPFYLHGSSSFFQLNEVKDLKALLRFLIVPDDNINFLHLLRSPWFPVEDQILADTIKDLKTKDIYYKWFFKKQSQHKSLLFLSLVVDEFNKLGAIYALYFFIKNSDILKSALFYDSSGRREANIWKFLVQLVQKSRVSNFNILNIEKADSGLDNLDQEEEAAAIFFSDQLQMMTIHKSKGLKFNHVILLGLEKKPNKTTSEGAKILFIIDKKNQFWTSPFKDNPKSSKTHNIYAKQLMIEKSQIELEEEERLFYVALTRSAESLYLSWVKKDVDTKLAKGSWALMCENFLATENFSSTKKLSEKNQSTIFKKEKYNILRSYLAESPNNLNLVCKNKNIKPDKKDKQLNILDNFKQNTTENQNSNQNSNQNTTQNTSNIKLPIFTVSNIMQFLSEKEHANKTTKHSTKEKDLINLKQIFKNKVEKGIKGSYWHKILEHFVFLLQNNKSKSEAVKDLKSLYHLSKQSISEQQIDEVINFIWQQSKLPFSEIVKKSFIEWEFQFCLFSNYFVEGKIDLWGWDKDCIWIIDYKFGSSKNTKIFFNQLELYAQGLSLKFPDKKIQLALIYPLDKKSEIKSFTGLTEKESLKSITADSFDRADV